MDRPLGVILVSMSFYFLFQNMLTATRFFVSFRISFFTFDAEMCFLSNHHTTLSTPRKARHIWLLFDWFMQRNTINMTAAHIWEVLWCVHCTGLSYCIQVLLKSMFDACKTSCVNKLLEVLRVSHDCLMYSTTRLRHAADSSNQDTLLLHAGTMIQTRYISNHAYLPIQLLLLQDICLGALTSIQTRN